MIGDHLGNHVVGGVVGGALPALALALLLRLALHRDLAQNHLRELGVVDAPVGVRVGVRYHLLHLGVRELLAEVHHAVLELGLADVTVAVAVEHPEGLSDLHFHVLVSEFVAHHDRELGEVEFAVVIDVDLVHNVHDFVLGGISAQRPHQDAELFGADEAVAVLEVTNTNSNYESDKSRIYDSAGAADPSIWLG